MDKIQAQANEISGVDIAAFIQGTATDGEVLVVHVFNDPINLVLNLVGSQAFAMVPSSANASINLQKNGSNIGSIDFATGVTVGTFTFDSAVSFAIGDRLSLVNQGTADATLADISITVQGAFL